MTIQNELNFRCAPDIREDEFVTQTRFDGAYGRYYAGDITTDDIMRAVEASGTLDFWNDPAEDRYDEQDGDPI